MFTDPTLLYGSECSCFGRIVESCDACASKISVSAYMCGCVLCSVFLLNLVVTSFVPLFDEPGLAVVSKLDVSKLISVSADEVLSVWLC